MRRRTLVVSVLATCLSPALPAVATGMDIAELLHASAIDTVCEQFGKVVRLSAQPLALDPPSAKQWNETADATFEGAKLKARLARLMDGKLTGAQIAPLADFYRSELGLRVSTIERSFSLLPDEQQMLAILDGESLLADMPDDRRPLIEALDAALAPDLTVVVTAAALRATLAGQEIAARRGESDLPWQEIDQQVDAMRPSLRLQASASLKPLTAHLYKTLSAEELSAYGAFLNTAESRLLLSSATDAIDSMLTRAVTEFAGALIGHRGGVNV